MSYLGRGLVLPGRALDIGCGPVRNAVYLASAGFEVDAVDLSPAAVAWARGPSPGGGCACSSSGDAFTFAGGALAGPCDLVYDSGCFHDLPPHRRVSYLDLLDEVLAPAGPFA